MKQCLYYTLFWENYFLERRCLGLASLVLKNILVKVGHNSVTILKIVLQAKLPKLRSLEITYFSET